MSAIFKKNAFFFVFVSLLLCLATGFTIYTFRLKFNSVNLEKSLQSRYVEMRQLNSLKPSANRGNLEEAKNNLEGISKKLEEVLKPFGKPSFIEELEDSHNSFWLLLKLREHQEALEKKLEEALAINTYGGGVLKGISHQSIKNFGFSRYLSRSRPSNLKEDRLLLRKIYLQKQLIAWLVDQIIATTPESIWLLKRQKFPEEENSSGRLVDEMSPSSSLPPVLEGIVSSISFEIGFTGYTQNLRAFLLSLQNSKAPFLVRNVTINNQAPGSRYPGVPTGDTKSEQKEPIVRNNLSSFRILIDYLFVPEVPKTQQP